MYNIFKQIQAAAEQLGTITNVKIFSNDKYWGDSVNIEGVNESGREFTLELTFKKKENEDA